MIKINLLQAKKEKRKAGVKKEFIVFILSIVILGVALAFVQWELNKKNEEAINEISKIKKEITNQKTLTLEVEKAKQAQKMLQDKLDIINALRKEKSGAAKIMEEVSKNKPERMQLEVLKKDGAKLSIEGLALDDETIVNFMNNLRKTMIFKSVDLIVSEQIEQGKIKMKKFSLSCEIILT